jgi:hypothetical protein
MPRISAASLSIARPAPGVSVRLAPPAHISDAERSVWLQAVNDQPAEAFTEVHAPLLEMYCRHVVQSRILAEELAGFERAWLADDEGLKRYDRLLAMSEREGRAASSLATRLRITRQAIHQLTSARQIANAPRGSKPWELTAR